MPENRLIAWKEARRQIGAARSNSGLYGACGLSNPVGDCEGWSTHELGPHCLRATWNVRASLPRLFLPRPCFLRHFGERWRDIETGIDQLFDGLA